MNYSQLLFAKLLRGSNEICVLSFTIQLYHAENILFYKMQ